MSENCSGAMTLHAMHYMIQKLFGWQNSHLHKFVLTDEDFDIITEGKVKGWTDLCGSLLRFPDGDFYDACWDDDYKEGVSVKVANEPFFRTIYYNYDYGDDWWVKITCEEIYSSIHDIPYTPDERLEEIVYKNKPLCIAAGG